MQIDLEREMARSLQLDVYDRETFERLLDELHCRVWPDARTRPARLTAFDGECY